MAPPAARGLLGLVVAGCLAAAGCSLSGAARRPSTAASQRPAPAAAAHAGPAHGGGAAPATAASLALSPAGGPAGTRVAVRVAGLPPGARAQVVWHTVKGSWVLTGTERERFNGRRFVPVSRVVATVRADARGDASASFRVRPDFGFRHRVTLDRRGARLATADFRLSPRATISPASGPLGTPITVRLQGVGYRYLHNSWLLDYDNRLTGWLSSVTTGGTAVAVLPATGAPGLHVIRIVEGSFSFPYLNWQQSPERDVPRFTLHFTVTGGRPVLPPPAADQGLPPLPGHAAPGTSGHPAIWTDPSGAQVGAPAVLRGEGFPAGATVAVAWDRMVGNHIGGKGWHQVSVPFGSIRANGGGDLRMPFRVPADLGGGHPIVATAKGGVSAATSMVVSPRALPLSRASGPAGTRFTVHVEGGGWTDTANIYTLVYDNAYAGFACAFNSQGDIRIRLRATGAPGWHFIDLYPAIFQGHDVPGVLDFRLPQLTYAQDHPGERLPAFHWAFRITGGAAG